MVCTPIKLINDILKGMQDNAMFWFNTTTIHATLFDANIFCHRISQLTQLTSGNISHPERFDQMLYIENGEESLQQIVSTLRE